MIPLLCAAPAEAAPVFLINAKILALLQIATSQNRCWIYTFDRNGNRLARNNRTYSSTGTWGSTVYGCFTWSQP